MSTPKEEARRDYVRRNIDPEEAGKRAAGLARDRSPEGIAKYERFIKNEYEPIIERSRD
ncbi:MAG: hypothetical protein WAV31_02530 [Candidatus Moraniibacteriota bacterium]